MHSSLGTILCEIKDFGESKLDTEILANAAAGKPTAGRSNPSPRTRMKIRSSIDQLAESKGKYNAVTVLFNPEGFPYAKDYFVREALHGRQNICFKVGPEGLVGPEQVLRDHQTQPGMNDPFGLFDSDSLKHVRAVAVLEDLQRNREVASDLRPYFR